MTHAVFALGFVSLASLACAASARSTGSPTAPVSGAVSTTELATEAEESAVFRDASIAERVADAETAWLLAHLADAPDPTHVGESDAVRRLVARGASGALAVAEVFRVGDTHRLPFARRVIERVAGRRCLHDRARTARVVTWLCIGGALPRPDPDAGIVWRDDARWSNAAVERLRAWAMAGAPCDANTLDASDAGAAP